MNYLTGFHAIEEALRAARRGEGDLYISGKGPRIRRIEELARKNGTPVSQVSAKEIEALAGAEHRGIVLKIEARRADLSVESFLSELTGDTALVLLLDGVTDPHNLGAILRSAEQFNVDLVCLPERRSAPDSEVVANSSAGAVHHVPHIRVPNLSRTAELLKAKGFWIYSAAAGGAPINRTDLGGRVAIVMGSEGGGVSSNLSRHCDSEISIPTGGKIDSLNVSVAAGIILYEVRRQQESRSLNG